MTLLRKLLKYHSLTLTDKLLLYTEDYEIYCHFLGEELEESVSYHSPLRDDDTCPSFCIYVPTRLKNIRPEEIWWKDQAKGDYGNFISFVKKYALHHYALKLNRLIDVVKFIDEEMQLGMFDSSKDVKPRVKIKRVLKKRDSTIRFSSRPFSDYDMVFWDRYHVITKEILKRFKVYSVKYLLNEDGTIRTQFPRNKWVFAYVCYDKVKLYQPDMPKHLKWRNTCLSNYFFGWEQLQGKDILVITKSLKDIMCFVAMCDIDCISPQSETTTFSPKLIAYLKKKYKRIILVMDYDLAGVTMANKLKEHFEVRFVSTKREMVNGRLKCLTKDLSDHLELKGTISTKRLLKKWKLPLINGI